MNLLITVTNKGRITGNSEKIRMLKGMEKTNMSVKRLGFFFWKEKKKSEMSMK